jgi:hypothetical protein
VVSGFLPRDLAPTAVAEAGRTDAEKAVLAFAEAARDPEGVR